MNIDVAIVLTIGSIAGSILITQMWQMNYFKRENFKFNLSQQKRADGIKFRKLERELGIKKGGLIASYDCPIDFKYFNDTDVSQTGTRTIELIVKVYKEIL